MKIGILSMQRIKNYGSFLQAYALKSTIEMLGHEVEFVDYKIEPPIIKKNSVNIEERNKIAEERSIYYQYMKFKSMVWRIIHYKDVKEQKQRRKIEEEKLIYNNYHEYLKILNIDSECKYRTSVDTLVIGSDEVFNCLQENTDVGYSKELFGYENNAKKVISYAASCGTTTIEGLKFYKIDREVGELLDKFSKIAVRDKNTAKVVTKLTNHKPIYTLDPVFIYNFDSLINNNVSLNNYIIVYAYEGRITEEEGNAIRAFAKKYNKKLVSLGVKQKCCDLFLKAEPFEVLEYFKKADYIITDTFHGTVFSIKYNKKFATIVREGNKQKLTDLLERFSLLDRRIEKVNELESKLIKEIDYKPINEFMDSEVKKSINYLRNSL